MISPAIKCRETQGQAHLVRSVLLVNVEDVDPQPVPLLEGAVAEVTRELAVPLVHAASVLEVLVPVVLVGKNLPAALTLEALPGFCRAEGTVPPPITPQQRGQKGRCHL